MIENKQWSNPMGRRTAVRTLYALAAAASLGLAGSVYAEPKTTEPPLSDNQQLADDVKARLLESGVATGAMFSVSTQGGVVELAGWVASDKQREQVVKIVSQVPGVSKVKPALQAQPSVGLVRVSAEEPGVSAQEMPAMPTSHPHPSGLPTEPLPLATGSQPAYDANGPHLPPYAWPTYAPYNNYSRVGYPTAYPYNAFPFIGPFYPFPKVPLGWRSVKLEWDDGHWYIGRLSTPHDYWRVKFW
jgi:hypothetical protein